MRALLKRVRADLHVHSCLSPCAEVTLSPCRIVVEAARRSLAMVALCDHNSGENLAAAVRAGRRAGVTVIPGMEITTREEVHVLGWFPSVEAALEVQAKVYANLPGRNDADRFGMQVIADEDDEVNGFCDKLLIGATELGIEEVVQAIHRAAGLAVPAHIDREAFGIIGQLGFVPPGLPVDALEVSRRMGLKRAAQAFPQFRGVFPLVCSSDAHAPEDIGAASTILCCAEPSFDELRAALAGDNGRRIIG